MEVEDKLNKGLEGYLLTDSIIDWEAYINNNEILFLEAPSKETNYLGGDAAFRFLEDFFRQYSRVHLTNNQFSLLILKINSSDHELENGTIYQYPKCESSLWRKIQGLFITLSQNVKDITSSEIICSIVNVHSEKLSVFYSLQEALIFCTIVSSELIIESYMQLLLRDYITLIKAKYSTLEGAFLCKDNIRWIDLISNVFMIEVLNSKLKIPVGLKCFSLSPASLLPYHDMLTTFESGELQCQECQRHFYCIGSALFCLNTLLVNHLPNDCLHIVYSLVRYSGLSYLYEEEVVGRSVIWCTLTRGDCLLIVCRDTLMLTGLFASTAHNSAKLKPDVEIVEQAFELLEQVKSILPISSNIALPENNPSLEATPQDCMGWLEEQMLYSCQHFDACSMKNWGNMKQLFEKGRQQGLNIKEIGIKNDSWLIGTQHCNDLLYEVYLRKSAHL